MYKPAPHSGEIGAKPSIGPVVETYLQPGEGHDGMVIGFTNTARYAVVKSGDLHAILIGTSPGGYSKMESVRFVPDGDQTSGGTWISSKFCKIDPITGIPINVQDKSTYEGTIEHLLGLGDKPLIYVNPSSSSRKLGASRTQLMNVNPETYLPGKPVGYRLKEDAKDMSDDHWLIESDEQKDDIPQINNSSIDFAFLDQETDTMLILSKVTNNSDGNPHLSIMKGNTVTLSGIEYIAVLTNESDGSNVLSDLGYPSNMIARGDYSQPKPLHQKVGDDTQTSILDVAGMSFRVSNVGVNKQKRQKLERLVNLQAQKIKRKTLTQ